LKTAAKAAGD